MRNYPGKLLLLFAVSALAGLSPQHFSAQTKINPDRARKAAAALPASRYVQANGIRIHYLEWGKGEATIVLLHGLYDTADIWASVAPLLAARFRVIALDRRGAGLSDKPMTGYDYATLARDVAEVIAKLNLGRAHVVGHSAGAGVALTVAAAAPGKVRTVTLVDGGFWPPRPKEAANAPLAPPCDDLPAECGRKAAIERGAQAYDGGALYRQVRRPVLLVMAVPKELETKEQAEGFAEARRHVEGVARNDLRDGRMVTVEDSGHWVQTDQPRQLAQAIEGFAK